MNGRRLLWEWYHRPMTTATAQARPDITFIRCPGRGPGKSLLSHASFAQCLAFRNREPSMLILLTLVFNERLKWQAVLGTLVAMLGVAVLFLA